MSYSWFFWMLAHKLSMLLFGVGVLFLVAWAIKYMKKDKLKKAGWSFVVAAIIIGLLGMFFGGRDYSGKWKKHHGMRTITCAEGDTECEAKKAAWMEKKEVKKAESAAEK